MEYEGKQRLLGNILGFTDEETLVLQVARQLASLAPLSSSIRAGGHHSGCFVFLSNENFVDFVVSCIFFLFLFCMKTISMVLKLEGFLSSSLKIRRRMPSQRTAVKRTIWKAAGVRWAILPTAEQDTTGRNSGLSNDANPRFYTPGIPRAFYVFQDARQNLKMGEVRGVLEPSWSAGFILGRNSGFSYPGSNRHI